VIEALCVVFIAVVGSQVEVSDDLHLLGKEIEDIPLEECVSDSFELFELELRPKMIEDGVCTRRVSTVLTERRDRGPVGARADEDLTDLLRRYLSVLIQGDRNVLVKPVDEEVKELVFVEFTVCLLGSRHTFRKQTSQLTGFVKY
jgi:hypothetical protein